MRRSVASFSSSTIRRFWGSPTFTSWGYQAIQALNLILIAPLLLRSYSQTEVAAWYLFASTNILGNVVTTRVSLTFSRLLSLEYGRHQNPDGLTPGFGPKVENLLSSMGALQLALSAVCVLAATLLGLLALAPLASVDSAPEMIWGAFAINQMGALINFFGSRYSSSLIGLGAIADCNRLNALGMITSLAGVAIGAVYKINLPLLSLLNQSAPLIIALSTRYVLKGNLNQFGVSAIDRIRWDALLIAKLRKPVFTGFLSQLGSAGLIPVSALVVARFCPAEVVAGYSLCSRIMTNLEQIALAPAYSAQPKISILLGRGDLGAVRTLLIQRSSAASILLGVGFIAMIALLPLAFSFSHSASSIPSIFSLLMIGLSLIVNRGYTLCLSAHYAKNEIVFWLDAVLVLALSLITFVISIPQFGLSGIGLGILLATVVVYRGRPYRLAAEFFEMSPTRLICRITVPAILVYLGLGALLRILTRR